MSQKKLIVGSLISHPTITYDEAVLTGTNPWVRRSTELGNADRILLVQFSSQLLSGEEESDPAANHYYDTLYSGVRPGYVRLPDFWEIPYWMAFVSYVFADADVYVIRDIPEALQFLNAAGYGRIAFSLMDINKKYIREIAEGYNGHIDVGGYVNAHSFDDLPHVKWHDTILSLTEDAGVPYREGIDYRHFEGSRVVPRITLSQGCLHRCAFCTVPKILDVASKAFIDQQVTATLKLDSKLMYVNDKTFGQAKNYPYLQEVAYQFDGGFIVQTTASQLLKIPTEWLKTSGIRYIELGVESYNNSLLRAMHKPANEAIIDKAVALLRECGIALIPNILIGYPGETEETYAHTLDFLRANADVISHVNVYNIAVYPGTELGRQVGMVNPNDLNENKLEKSFHGDTHCHRKFADEIYTLSCELVSRPRIS
jgi:hypothetical protein